MKLILLILSLAFFSACMRQKKADVIVVNGIIYTVDSNFSTAGSMVIIDGKIEEVGNSDELLKKYISDTIIDAGGNPIFPGFIDAHCHFFGYGLDLSDLNLVGVSSKMEALSMVSNFIKNSKENWIIGRGWDQNLWETKEFPNKKDLDAITMDQPLFLKRIDGHAAWVNSKALQLAGIDEFTKVAGGEVVLENGKPSGILIDNAVSLIEKILPKPTHSALTDALLKAQKKCFEVGLTSVHDAGLEYGEVMLIDSLQKVGSLQMRIYAMLTPGNENLSNFVEKGIYITPDLSVRSIKLYADGALGSRGALLLEDYADMPDHKGLLMRDTAFFKDMCKVALENGYQVNTHCIGDGANHLILNIYGEILKGKNDLRWRVEHSQIVANEDVNLFGDFNIIPSVQPTHATSDMNWVVSRLGQERIGEAYSYKTLLQQNGWIANGSDFPVESINPIYGFYAAITRKDLKGDPENGFRPSESLTREEALKGMTIWAANAAFEEGVKGSIEKGKYADFVILDKDILTVNESEIPNVQVLQTFKNGKEVFNRK